jgi:hypothetical protein
VKIRTSERLYAAGHAIWLFGLGVFLAGGVVLDSWPTMGVGVAIICVGLLVMGAAL